MNYNLNITSKVWDREVNSFHDYDVTQYKFSKLTVCQDCNILFDGYKFTNIPLNYQQQKNNKTIVNIKRGNDIYELNLMNDPELEIGERKEPIKNKTWMSIRDTFENSGYRIHLGDILKIGNIELEVVEMKIEKKNKSNIKNKETLTLANLLNIDFCDTPLPLINQASVNINKEIITNSNCKKPLGNLDSKINFHEEDINSKLIFKQIKKKTENVPMCKICLCQEYEVNNPLVASCLCSGTMKYIHLSCLILCFKSKICSVIFTHFAVYFYNQFHCDLCKTPIPDKIKIRNNCYSLVELQKPETNYMILENHLNNRARLKFVYIISMKDKKSLKIGRSIDSDVRITDISVSSKHAEINLIDNYFYIRDFKSKFGTFVETLSNLIVLPHKSLTIQFKNNIFVFSMTRKFLPFITCYNPTEIPYGDYNELVEIINRNYKAGIEMAEKTNIAEVENYDSSVNAKPKTIIRQSVNGGVEQDMNLEIIIQESKKIEYGQVIRTLKTKKENFTEENLSENKFILNKVQNLSDRNSVNIQLYSNFHFDKLNSQQENHQNKSLFSVKNIINNNHFNNVIHCNINHPSINFNINKARGSEEIMFLKSNSNDKPVDMNLSQATSLVENIFQIENISHNDKMSEIKQNLSSSIHISYSGNLKEVGYQIKNEDHEEIIISIQNKINFKPSLFSEKRIKNIIDPMNELEISKKNVNSPNSL